jgi:hypothetical protein
MKYVVNVTEDVAGIFRTYLPIQASAVSFFMDTCDQVPLILLKMKGQIYLMPRLRSVSGCDRVHENACFAHQGG